MTLEDDDRASRVPKTREELIEGIGERLRRLRDVFEMTQKDFAATIGVAPGTYCQWECERQRVPRARRLQICREYQVRRDWLEFGAGKMFEKYNTAPLTDEQSQYFERLEIAKKFLAEMSEDFRRALYILLAKEFDG